MIQQARQQDNKQDKIHKNPRSELSRGLTKDEQPTTLER